MLTDRRGQAGVLTAIAAPVIVGFAALAIDAALWQVNQRALQGAADQASIAGINAYVLSGDNGAVATDTIAQKAALAVAKSFGYDACPQTPGDGCPCTSGFGACAGKPVAPTSVTCIATPTNCLLVTITEQQSRFLSQVVYSGQPVASASATTTVGAGGACVLALDQKTAGSVPANPPSVSLTGSSVLTLSACNLVNNLNDPGATKDESTVTGTSELQATDGGQILLAQTDQYFGSGQVTPTPVYGTSPAPDPYANRAAPTITGTHCDYPNSTINTLNNINASNLPPASILSPGIYCGGLNITGSGGAVVLNLVPTATNSTFIMDGGGFNAQGNVTITGTGVTLYVTCSTQTMTYSIVGNNGLPHQDTYTPNCSGNNYGSVNITGTGGTVPKVTLTAPVATTSPPTGTAGISVWIDKNAPISGTSGCGGSCGTATFTGDAGLNINGAIYAPTQAVTYEGGDTSTASTQCNQLVSLTVNMSGGHETSFSQKGCAANSGVAGHGVAQLVE